MEVRFKDPVFDGQLLRALSHVYYGGADVGECISTAARIREGDAASWHDEWSDTAQRIYSSAEKSCQQGHQESAREGDGKRNWQQKDGGENGRAPKGEELTMAPITFLEAIKQALFEELVRTAIVPLITRLATPPPAGSSLVATSSQVMRRGSHHQPSGRCSRPGASRETTRRGVLWMFGSSSWLRRAKTTRFATSCSRW